MGQTKARSQEFRSSLPCGRQAVQVLESSSGSLPRPSAADSRVDQLGHEQAHKRDAGATGGDFTHCTTMLAPQGFGFKQPTKVVYSHVH